MVTTEGVVKVSVKWMGKKYDDLEFQNDEPIELFQAQLSSLTGVPPERQKLIYKGTMLNNPDKGKVKVTNGARIMMIGTAEKLVESSEKQRIFEEMSKEEQARLMEQEKLLTPPAGIMNLGNTCYFNAVLQFLRPVKELWEGIEKMQNNPDIDRKNDSFSFVRLLLDMHKQLYTVKNRYVPLPQVTLLRLINPLFNRKDERTGTYLQQDAEECLSCILNCMNAMGDERIVEKLFGYVISSKYKPKEAIEGTDASSLESTTKECSTKLNCYMGTQLTSVGTIMDGILLSLNEDVEKFSESIGRNLIHEKVGRISTPPRYLIVHLVRFEWKKESEVSKTDAVKAKVCRRVNFERILDISPICNEELKEKLNAANAVAMKTEFGMGTSTTEPLKGYELYPGEYATGRYELQSIVTHQGRTADGGHYVCWTKDTRGVGEQSEGKNKTGDTWIKYDDDQVTEVPWGSFNLCGGRSDYHIAVLLLYKSQCVRLDSTEGVTASGPQES